MKQIRTDIFDFELLRKSDLLYVDKTDFVWDLVKGPGTYFMSRPRRFGKSLLLSTFKSFFEGRRDLFEGLRIAELAPGVWEKHPVVSISMTRASAETPAMVEEKLKRLVEEEAKTRGVTVSGVTASDWLNRLILALKEKTGKDVVVLVDEYDKPILDNLFQDNIHGILRVLKDFYQVIKDRNGDIRFAFITGVTKFAHTSMFSGFNNPTDITRAAPAATMLGYTQEELEANFADRIPIAAEANGMDRETFLRELKAQYDGFRFEEKSETVYNPVSIGMFFQSNKFLNFWADTGTPTFLVETAKRVGMDIEARRSQFVDELDFGKYEVDSLDPFVFAVQCGYLTIAETKKVGLTKTLYRMDYPNREVRDTFSKFLFNAYTGRNQKQQGEIVSVMREALGEGDVETFMRYIRGLVAGLAWGNIGDDALDPTRFYEGYFRNVLSLTMTLLNIDNEPETRTADGQIDLTAHAGDWRFVMELKVGDCSTDEKTNAIVAKAMDQALVKKRYAEKYSIQGRRVVVLALAFDLTTRKLGGWKEHRIQ